MALYLVKNEFPRIQTGPWIFLALNGKIAAKHPVISLA
jgi:hypothetical protein